MYSSVAAMRWEWIAGGSKVESVCDMELRNCDAVAGVSVNACSISISWVYVDDGICDGVSCGAVCVEARLRIDAKFGLI